jgi:CubicO group peptidase (beta-lactamase class C family)
MLANTDLAKQIDTTMQGNGASGTLLVVQNGKPIVYQAYGESDKNSHAKNTVNSLYNIASIEKNLTAVLVMRAVADGKFSLNDPVAKFYPNLPNAGTVTIQQLLNMTSGYKQVGTTEETLDEGGYNAFALDHITQQTGGWFYSAANYVVLVGILRQVYGQDFQTTFNQYFVDKLGLPIVTYPDFLANADRTHATSDQGVQYYDNAPIFNREIGTGNVQMTPATMYRFLRLELSGKLISANALQQMLTTGADETYAAGMYLDQGDAYWMHGILMGYEPSIMASRDGQSMVIWFSNADATGSHFNMNLTKQIYTEIGGQ